MNLCRSPRMIPERLMGEAERRERLG